MQWLCTVQVVTVLSSLKSVPKEARHTTDAAMKHAAV